MSLIAAFCMIALMGALALAVDAGQLRYQKNKLQRVADAAALAAMLEVSACAGVPSCAAMKQAASSAATENGVTPTSIVTNCATASATGMVLMLNNPPCALGSADPNSGQFGYVEVVTRQAQNTLFGRFLNINTVSLAARAEASIQSSTCIYSLKNYGNATFVIDTDAQVNSSCGAQAVATSGSSVDCESGGVMNAPSVKFAGGISPNACTITPMARTNVSVNQADPLAGLPTPSIPPCGTTTASPFHGSSKVVTISDTATFYPDKAYCGGIQIAVGATVTFQPGTYVLTSNKTGGGLTLNVGANATGNGVTFYNYGPSGKIGFIQAQTAPSSGLNLVAPTTGTYAGILFFQDANNSDQATIFGSTNFNTVLEGMYYFPGAKAVIAYGGQVHYNGLVAYTIEFATLKLGGVDVTTTIANDYSSLPGGSPLASTGSSGGILAQ